MADTGPSANLSPHHDIERVLYDEGAIRARLAELGRELTREYSGRELTVVAILHGGVVFLADLLRRIDLPLRVATVSVSSYHGGTRSSGVVEFAEAALPDLRGQDVLVLDDILDTGRTLHAVKGRLAGEGGAASVRTCVLLSKRRPREAEVEPDFVAFEIGDEFVVGYGLDYRGRYRNLPLVGVLAPGCIAPEDRGQPAVAAGGANPAP